MTLLQALLLLQVVTYSSPPTGDTAGYWQQRVHYTIRATLDERAQVLRAHGTLRYVNASPDTLHDLWFHQYLNAFRPHSKWSATDEREGRVRFQHLAEPDYGFERLATYDWPSGALGREARGPGVLIEGGSGGGATLVQVQYPMAPDSTVAHVPLPEPLAPGDSITVTLEWDARPSTVPRRQGRRGRQWDFAQWYPKVAVYDRGGWEYNPLRPAGELYGEFGTYDVTLVVPDDQVIGATGVPVSGDPGWSAVQRAGEVHLAADAYANVPPAPDDSVPAGYKAVRFVARDVHHFAWTVAPFYRHEGAMYDDRVAVHVLYRPGDEPAWGNGIGVRRTLVALAWLEWLYGPYQYPQITVTHRIEGGATEFPMMIMNSSASQGLILHELGHVYTYGMLANNEWRAGWMDEGLTEFQTEWAQNMTLPERARGLGPEPVAQPHGYRGHARKLEGYEQDQVDRYEHVLLGRAQPIGTIAHEFHEFGLYNESVYTTADAMYAALRQLLGDSTFVRFTRTYFDRWKLKHVDELAMRRAAEDACTCELGWFFDQWVHRVGLTDYALGRVEQRREGDRWLTRARVRRLGAYRSAMPVGVRTDSGWTLVTAAPLPDEQEVEIRTVGRPRDVRVDPLRETDDWDRRNDVRSAFPLADARVTRHVLDWPLLDQLSRNRTVAAWRPMLWYGDPGGATPSLRLRTSYLGLVDRREIGVAVPARVPDDAKGATRVQGWVTVENPRMFGGRPLMGWSAGGWMLDGVAKVQVRRQWDLSPFVIARDARLDASLAVTGTTPYSLEWVDGRRWQDVGLLDATGAVAWENRSRTLGASASASGGYAHARASGLPDGFFGRAQAAVRRTAPFGEGSTVATARLYAGLATRRTPLQRALGVSARDPIESFDLHLYRPSGAPLARTDVGFIPAGGAGLRGYSPLARARSIGALNVELARALTSPRRDRPRLWLTAFGDAAYAGKLVAGNATTHAGGLVDAGVGLALRGKLYDREIGVRADLPFFVSRPSAAVVQRDHDERFAFRWAFGLDAPL
jgi:hypothetical protein